MTRSHCIERKAPTPGDEKIVLVPPGRKGGRHRCERRVWTDQGFTTFYDEDALDWVRWHGSWTTVELLGRFHSPAAARDFLIARPSGQEDRP